MQSLSFGISTLLALAGIGSALFGIFTEAWKPAAVGLVMIFGAGVFATLYLGTRWTAHKRVPGELHDLPDR